MGYVIFTDGASSYNPGPSGYGVVFKDPAGHVVELGGGEEHSTNNRMELLAVIEALKLLKEPGKVIVYSDSSYVLQGITNWRFGWVRSGWVNSSKKEVVNKDMWILLCKVLDPLLAIKTWQFTWQHVPGHAGIPGNERADEIASSYAQKSPVELYSGGLDGYTVDLTVKDAALLSQKKKKAQKKSSSKKPFGYVSYIAGRFEFDKTWSECDGRIKKNPGGKLLYRKVFSKQEVEEYRAKWTRTAK